MSATGDRRFAGPGEAGETLIEALVVVAIVGLMAGVGFTQMRQGLLAVAQRETVASVVASLRGARADALRRNARVAFVISGDGRAYGAAGGVMAAAPAGVRISSTRRAGGAIVFYGDGSSPGGWVRVRAGPHQDAIIVDRDSGVAAMSGS